MLSEPSTSDSNEVEIQQDLSLSDLHTQVSSFKTEQNNTPTMEEIEELMKTASTTINTIDKSNTTELSQLSNDIHSLRTAFEDVIDKGMNNIPRDNHYFEMVLNKFPNSLKDREQLRQMEIDPLEQVSFDQLSLTDQSRYVKLLAEINYQYQGSYDGGCYWFGFGFAKHTQGAELLNDVMVYDKKLTPEEEQIVYEDERNTFKLHLTVPTERKIEVLKVILSAKRNDTDIATRLLREKKARGERESVNREEIRAAGAKGLVLSTYKMAGSNYNPNNVADFIFYANETQNDSAEEIAKQMAKQLCDILAPLNLPSSESLPRYSTPVFINGERIPGLSFTQGNGDFKDYLRRNDPTALDRFYDRTRNWGLRPNTTLSFDN